MIAIIRRQHFNPELLRNDTRVTIAAARPLTAASSTISSAGFRKSGRHMKWRSVNVAGHFLVLCH
jgi:hypothetical protein